MTMDFRESLNLNLMTRRELLDSLLTLNSHGDAYLALTAFLSQEPQEAARDQRDDIFEIDFGHSVLEEIAYAVEQYAWTLGEGHAVQVEDEENVETDSAHFYYWQKLSEQWHYLELMVD